MQCWEMYLLLKKHKIKPWEYNGGKVYPEDIRAILEFDKIVEHKKERERKKAEMRQRAKASQNRARSFH